MARLSRVSKLGERGIELEDLLPASMSFLVHISPAIVALAWPRFSIVPRVKSVMKLTAVLVASVVISLFLFIGSAETLCAGSALKGYNQCSLIPVYIANLVSPVYLLSMAVIAVWCLVVTAKCCWAEFEVLKNRDFKQ
ncbi:hypothetical protein [Chachezhania antarctica]|uniref:hypothetical protein n=1 Tax=Chachezhania antarctica TaxID=2340860 RepID=UPI0013CE56A5|nr:hypothetical protein [Chachezhania antarctica]